MNRTRGGVKSPARLFATMRKQGAGPRASAREGTILLTYLNIEAVVGFPLCVQDCRNLGFAISLYLALSEQMRAARDEPRNGPRLAAKGRNQISDVLRLRPFRSRCLPDGLRWRVRHRRWSTSRAPSVRCRSSANRLGPVCRRRLAGRSNDRCELGNALLRHG